MFLPNALELLLPPSITQNDHAKSTGDSPLEITQANEVEAKTQWARDGMLNWFNVNLQFLNNSDANLAITDFKSEYEDKQGNWHPVTNTCLGKRYSDYEYRWLDVRTFTLVEKETITLAVQSVVEFPEVKNYVERYRAHHTFPVPARFRITFTDSDNKTSTIVVEWVNGQLRVENKEDYERSNPNEPAHGWYQADDTDAMTRMTVVVSSHLLSISTKFSLQTRWPPMSTSALDTFNQT